MRVQFTADFVWVGQLTAEMLTQEQSQQLCFPKDDAKIKQIVAKKYFFNLKSGSCQEHGIAIISLSWSQPHHKNKVTRILLLMTADMAIALGVAAARQSLDRGTSLQKIFSFFQPGKYCLS